MLPEELARLLFLHAAAGPTGTGLNPRLAREIEARRAAALAAPQPDAALPGAERIAGGPRRPSAVEAAQAVATGAALAFPRPRPEDPRREARG